MLLFKKCNSKLWNQRDSQNRRMFLYCIYKHVLLQFPISTYEYNPVENFSSMGNVYIKSKISDINYSERLMLICDLQSLSEQIPLFID